MWITEYNEEMSHAMFRQQGYDEGVAIGEARGEARGEERGLVRGIAKLVKSGVITLAQGAEQLETPEPEFVQKAAELGFELR